MKWEEKEYYYAPFAKLIVLALVIILSITLFFTLPGRTTTHPFWIQLLVTVVIGVFWIVTIRAAIQMLRGKSL